MRKSPTCPPYSIKEKRQKVKLNRNFGQLAIEKANITEIEWARKHDPLFKVKGIKRHILTHL